MASGVEIGRGYIAITADDKGARSALGAFRDFAGRAFAATAIAATATAAGILKMSISFNSMKEQAGVAFTSLLKSGAASDKMLKDLTAFAAKTPFELPGVIEGAKKLLGVGMAAENVIPTLQALGNASGALGLNQEQFGRVLTAVSQMMAKGKVSAEELLQIAETGIPIYDLLAKATGKSVPELQKLMEKGQLLSADVLPKLFAQMEKDYGGAMIAQSQTLQGRLSTLKDTAKILSGTALKPLFDDFKGLIGVTGDLASSDAAMRWAERVAAGIETAERATSIFVKNAAEKFGPDLRRIWAQVSEEASGLWDSISNVGINAFQGLVKVVQAVIPHLHGFGAAGDLVKAAIDALGRVMEVFNANASKIGNLIGTAFDTARAIAVPVLQAMGVVLKIAADALGLLIGLVGRFSGPLGTMIGIAAGGVIAWKALSAAWGIAATAVGGLSRMVASTTIASGMDNMALKAGVMTERFTGSANAGMAVASAGSKVGSVLSKVGAALPIVGVAAIGLGMAFEAQSQRAQRAAQMAEEWGRALNLGGRAAEEAARKIDMSRMVADRYAQSNNEFSNKIAENLRNMGSGAEEFARKQTESMSSVERAQQNATRAQNDYDLAVERFGPTSSQATSALNVLKNSTEQLQSAQLNAATAAQTQAQAIQDLADKALAGANADLQYRLAQQQVTASTAAYTQAVQQHGIASNEAQQAALNQEQAMLRAAEAVRQKSLADNAGKSEAVRATESTRAYTFAILDMAAQAGGNAPPALQRLISSLTATQLSASGVTVRINEAGQAVYRLPNGKEIPINVHDAQARGAIAAVQRDLAAVQSKTVTLTVLRTGDIASSGGGRMFERASGGFMKPGQPYLTQERGPEIIVPTTEMFAYNAQDTQAMLKGAGATGKAGTTINQTNVMPSGLDPAQTADLVADRIRWVTG